MHVSKINYFKKESTDRSKGERWFVSFGEILETDAAAAIVTLAMLKEGIITYAQIRKAMQDARDGLEELDECTAIRLGPNDYREAQKIASRIEQFGTDFRDRVINIARMIHDNGSGNEGTDHTLN